MTSHSQTNEIGRLHESTANTAIADWLKEIGHGWAPNAERRRTLVGSAGRPDIIIRQGNRTPVVIETEFGAPAIADAARRLGHTLRGQTTPITQVIALGIDAACEYDDRAALLQRLDDNEQIFTVQVVKGAHETEAEIWPSENPLVATPFDLVAYCEYSQVPQVVIEEHGRLIAEEIEATSVRLLNVLRQTKSRGSDAIATLRQLTATDDDESAARNVCAIWLIAIDLQNDLARYSDEMQERGLKTTAQLQQQHLGVLIPQRLLDEWKLIEDVNYEAVMTIAITTLAADNLATELSPVLDKLASLSEQIDALNVKHVYNFVGELWQRLIKDRKARAANYTRPPVAEMLATASVARFAGRSRVDLRALNLWDAACGTGTLVGAGERALRRLYIRKGGNAQLSLHKDRMEQHIYAMDVNSIAGTLTAKRLTDLEVEQAYDSSNVALVDHEAGSLYLLDPEQTTIKNLLGHGGESVTPANGEDAALFGIPLSSMDWALMNPPYNVAHYGASLATTGLAPLRRKAAAARDNVRAAARGYVMSNGKAGLASHFGDISNMRLQPHGVYAHVLPLTAAHAGSWSAWRAELETDFDNIVVIANVGAAERSMSADTGMNEMLVIATKKAERPAELATSTITAVALQTPPETLEQGYALGREIAALPPTGAEGAFDHGQWVRTKAPRIGFPWIAVGTGSTELTHVADALINARCWDPLDLVDIPVDLAVTRFDAVAEPGPTHDRIGHPEGGDGRGAFRWKKLNQRGALPTHIAMWSSDAATQQRLIVRPTHGGTVVRRGKVRELNEQRSLWFFARNIRWTSQALSIAHTQVAAHGGGAWNALQSPGDRVGRALAIWWNSIFGAIVRHLCAVNTQAGRATIQLDHLAGLPCPDFTADSAAARRALDIAEREFDRLAALELEPFGFCFQDPNRHQIDLAAAAMLGLDPNDAGIRELLARYRLLFAREPNVNGRKRAILAALAEYE